LADFYNILTLLGEAEYAEAIAGSTVVNLTHVVLGDSNGAYYEPNRGQNSLVNEVYRAGINSITTDPENPGWVIIELVVPATEGGWWIREAGIISVTSNLFAVGKFPATYKPVFTEGAGKELIIRLIFEVASTEVISLVIDPNITVAKVSDIEDHNEAVDAHTDIRTKIGTDIGTHNTSGTAHTDIRTAINTKESLWVTESAEIARVSDAQFTVAGDKTGTYTKNRALFLDQTTDAYGYVKEPSTYSSGTELTTVTVRECTVDAGLSAVKYGQEVANAPKRVDDLFITSTGSGNAYVLTLVPAITAHVPGMPVIMKANHTNTGAATVAINGMDAVAIKKNVGTALAAGDIVEGQLIILAYDGTNYQLINSHIMELASSAEILAGTDAVKAATAAALLAGLLGAGSTAAAGYATIPFRDASTGERKNIIIQWQIVSMTEAGNTVQTFSRPMTFPNGVLMDMTCDTTSSGGGALPVGVVNSSCSASQVALTGASATVLNAVNVISVGY